MRNVFYLYLYQTVKIYVFRSAQKWKKLSNKNVLFWLRKYILVLVLFKAHMPENIKVLHLFRYCRHSVVILVRILGVL